MSLNDGLHNKSVKATTISTAGVDVVRNSCSAKARAVNAAAAVVYMFTIKKQHQRRSEGLWHPGRRLPFGAPPPPPDPPKNL